MKDLPIFRQVRDSYLAEAEPAGEHDHRDLRLAREGALLEIEAVAVLPAAARAKAAPNPPQVRAAGAKRATKASRRESEGEQREDRQQDGARPDHVAEEARHLDAALDARSRRP